MAKALRQQALERVMAYLRLHGIEATPEVCRQARRVVDLARMQGTDSLEGRAVELIPAHFELPLQGVAQQRPPLQRDSIGYHPHV